MSDVNLLLCRTSHLAKISHLHYLNVYLVPFDTLGCNCLPKCRTRIYETRMAINDATRHSYSVSASNNVVEIYRKVPAYPLVKLLCDIGGLLGSVLGLCVLTAIEIALGFFNTKKSKAKAHRENFGALDQGVRTMQAWAYRAPRPFRNYLINLTR